MKLDGSTLALITARGGSKSIPQKNLVSVLGKPLISWTIELALKCSMVDRVIVSTDDKDIARISQDYGAEVPFLRPSKYSKDDSLDIDAFLHAIDWLRSNEGCVPDFLVHLRPTEPARESFLVDQAIQKLKDNSTADSLRSVSVANQTPFKMWFIDGNWLSPVVDPSGDRQTSSKPRQTLPMVYHQNGYVDVIRTSTIVDKRSMVGNNTLAFLIASEITSIDYLDDIRLAEFELQKLIQARDEDSRATEINHGANFGSKVPR